MYERHPSSELNALFARKPYQGVEPSSATFLFVGLDANYEGDIGAKPIFDCVLSYHDDAVGFWKKYGLHHPFLLPTYTGGGRLYHRSFARIGFRPEDAELVSFAELLHIPTVGRNRLRPPDLERLHLQWLNSAIINGRSRHVFLSSAVSRLMRASGQFPWLPAAPIDTARPLNVLYRAGDKTVYSHLHFSVYGKFEAQKAAEARAIAALLPSSDEH